MKTIIKLTGLILITIFGFQSANGSKLPSSINRLISKEVNSITGNDTIITYIKVIDSIKYTGNFNFKVPYGWQIYLISGPSAG